MRETWVRSLGWEDPLEKRKATHSSILAWRILWTTYASALSIGRPGAWPASLLRVPLLPTSPIPITDFSQEPHCLPAPQPARHGLMAAGRGQGLPDRGSGLPFPSPEDLPYPGIETRSPALWADALSSKPPGKPVSVQCAQGGLGFQCG